MKRILLPGFVVLSMLCAGVLYSRPQYQMVDVYVCASGLIIAEMIAKISVSRKELYRVSYCDCEGIHPSMKSEVRNMSCEPPNSHVYLCVCTGTSSY